jgi:hypothetical protein
MAKIKGVTSHPEGHGKPQAMQYIEPRQTERLLILKGRTCGRNKDTKYFKAGQF